MLRLPPRSKRTDTLFPYTTLFRSDRPLLVDFKNEGLTLELRRDGNVTPVVLTAPAAGLQYVGDTMSAMFSGNELKIEEGDKPPVLCRKDRKSTRLNSSH